MALNLSWEILPCSQISILINQNPEKKDTVQNQSTRSFGTQCHTVTREPAQVEEMSFESRQHKPPCC